VNTFLLWIAQGFGSGRMPVAPGTFGSLVGLLWFALLLLPGNFGCFLAGTLAGLALSVWLADLGEKVLRRKDPASVVIDEIAAMPLCFLGWLALEVGQGHAFPAPSRFCSKELWPLVLVVFVAFRVLDVVKPWPVRQSQALVGGWGITADDVLAAGYVNVIVLALHFAGMLPLH
jgi:phosphatidylglycerophosphatase A